jgi:hypothetical protein
MTSDVSCGSALMLDSPGFVWRAHSANKRRRTQITTLRASQAAPEPGTVPGSEREKEQGRRRSIPPTALPAPDIKIGFRHPVNCRLPREHPDKCDPVHNRRKKVAAGPWEGLNHSIDLVWLQF